MTFRVIAVCGMRRSGKDTIAKCIEELCEYKHVKISARLKQMCNLLFGFTAEQMEESIKDVVDERIGITPRKAMQFVGTEMMQYKIQELLPSVGRSFWIDALLQQERDPIVISDMRFLHEARAIRKMWGSDAKIIKVTRQGDGGAACDHISEKEWMEIKEDVLLVNDKSIDDLVSQVKQLIETNGT